jgi:UDP-glucose 4-epimerase
MTVLVTGGAGYIGSHMVLKLLDGGNRVVVLDDLSTGFPWAVPEKAVFVEGDVADGPLVERILNEHHVEAIVHFAAKIVVPDSVADPLGYYLANTMKTRNLIEATVRAGVGQFVFSSTAAVYGNPPVSPVGEDVPPTPMSPYGTSKLMSEWMLRDAAAAHGLRYVALRYFNVAGADPKGRAGQSTPNATHLIKVAVQTALGRRPSMDVYGTDYETRDGTCVRDYIHVVDLAAAHVLALAALAEAGPAPSEVFNVGCGGSGYTVRTVIQTAEAVTGRPIPARVGPRRPGDPAVLIASPAKIERELGWLAKRQDLRVIIESAWQWMRVDRNKRDLRMS